VDPATICKQNMQTNAFLIVKSWLRDGSDLGGDIGAFERFKPSRVSISRKALASPGIIVARG
jgi:hypothetical protein